MRRAALCCLLLAVFTQVVTQAFTQALAQEAPRRFPLEQRFVVTYLNGQDFAPRSLTLTVSRIPGGKGLRATGFAGCNTWFARIELGDGDRLAVSEVGSTRKFCHRERMRTEAEFLAVLTSLAHWRIEGRTLVLSGDSATLVLTPASRTAQL
jgi:heat shock protein HslJ